MSSKSSQGLYKKVAIYVALITCLLNGSGKCVKQYFWISKTFKHHFYQFLAVTSKKIKDPSGSYLAQFLKIIHTNEGKRFATLRQNKSLIQNYKNSVR